MECFQVRYDSRVVIYECKLFIRLAPGHSATVFVHSGLNPWRECKNRYSNGTSKKSWRRLKDFLQTGNGWRRRRRPDQLPVRLPKIPCDGEIYQKSKKYVLYCQQFFWRRRKKGRKKGTYNQRKIFQCCRQWIWHSCIRVAYDVRIFQFESSN